MLLALQELMVAVDLVLALLIKLVQAVLALARQVTLGMEALVCLLALQPPALP